MGRITVSNVPGVPWDRYALIADLARRLDGISPQFGKTALEKLVYFLQEVYAVDCGYDFELYSYGPYSAQLLSDLDMVKGFGAVAVERTSAGYDIKPAAEADAVRARAKEFLDSYKTTQALASLVG